MTFLADEYEGPRQARRGIGDQSSTAVEGWVAKAQMEALRSSTAAKPARVRRQVEDELSSSIAGRIPKSRMENSTLIYKPFGPRLEYGETSPVHPSRLLEIAREEAAANPEAWQDVDLSEEWVEAQVNEQLQAERDDLAGIIAMSPQSGIISEFTAAMTGTMADPINLAAMMAGGGSGSLLRIIGREAMLNVAAETAMMPQRFDMADRLEEPAPNVVAELAMAGAFGGAFGGGVEALRRGVMAFKRRGAIPKDLPQTPEVEATINAIEDMIVNDEPLENIIEKARDIVPPRASAPDEIVVTPLPDAEPSAAINPVMDELIPDMPKPPKGPRPERLTTFIVKKGGIFKGDDRGDLAALDYRRPGFLKKDKIVRSSAGNNGGGLEIDYMREAAAEAGYLPMDSTISDFLDLIAEDANPHAPNVYRMGDDDFEFAQYERNRIEIEKMHTQGGAVADFRAGEDTGRGLFIDLNDELLWFDTTPFDEITMRVDSYLEDIGLNDVLTPLEKQNIVKELEKSGGDGAYLVEHTLTKAYNATRGPDQNVGRNAENPTGQLDRQVGREASRPEPLTEPTPGSRTSEAGDGTPAQFEQTQAGDQRLIDGVAPVAQRDRLQAQMDGPLRGGDAAADGGLFDLNGRAHTDMLSDPGGPASKPFQKSALKDFLSSIDVDGDVDLDIVMEDGTRITSASDLLRYADEGMEFSEIIDLCGGSR